jgi:hypothetical protein
MPLDKIYLGKSYFLQRFGVIIGIATPMEVIGTALYSRVDKVFDVPEAKALLTNRKPINGLVTIAHRFFKEEVTELTKALL